ncbi:MAG: histidine kinase [Flavobacteriaceae bacterium]
MNLYLKWLLPLFFLITNFGFSQNEEAELRKKTEISKDTSLVKAYLDLAKYYYQTTGKGDSLAFYSAKALDLSEAQKNKSLEIEAIKYLGVGNLTLKNFKEAEKNFKEGLKLVDNSNNFKIQADFHNKLGTLYQNMDRNVLAIEHLLQAVKISEKINDLKNVAQANYAISYIYAIQKQYNKQLDYIKKAIEVAENNNIQDPLMENVIYSFASQQYLDLYNRHNDINYLDLVFEYSQKALKLAKDNNFNSRVISSYAVLSNYYIVKKDYKNSEFYAKQVLKKRALTNETVIINAYENLGNIYKTKNQKALTLAYVDSLNNLQIKSTPYYGANISQFSYQAYKHFNLPNQALKALEEKSEFEKELNDKEKNKAINELETKYKTELKDAEILSLNQQQKIASLEIENKQAQIKRQNVWLIIAALVIVLILFFGSIIQLKRIRQKNEALKIAFDKQLVLEKELSNVRDNIAQDFHDDLGNKLARISLLSNLVADKLSDKDENIKTKIKQIKEDANTLFVGTKDFVFSLKSNSDYLEEVVTYLSDFGEDLFKNTSIKFVLQKNLDANIKLPYYWSKQLIYIFKEAMTNTLKHSKCSEVILIFKYQDNQLDIQCLDNGIGVSDEQIESSNGIQNMKERAFLINGELEIKALETSGTVVQFIGNTTQ